MSTPLTEEGYVLVAPPPMPAHSTASSASSVSSAPSVSSAISAHERLCLYAARVIGAEYDYSNTEIESKEAAHSVVHVTPPYVDVQLRGYPKESEEGLQAVAEREAKACYDRVITKLNKMLPGPWDSAISIVLRVVPGATGTMDEPIVNINDEDDANVIVRYAAARLMQAHARRYIAPIMEINKRMHEREQCVEKRKLARRAYGKRASAGTDMRSAKRTRALEQKLDDASELANTSRMRVLDYWEFSERDWFRVHL